MRALQNVGDLLKWDCSSATLGRALLCLTVLCFSAHAQEADETEAPAAPAKPRPAEIAPLSASSLLLAVTAAGDKLVVVGDRGNILLSADGANWEQVAVPVNSTLTTVAFADAQHGWAGGHDAAILHTADGGKTWTLQHFNAEINKPVLHLHVIDKARAFAIGAYGLFLTTQDGGKTWTQLEAPAILEEGLHLNALVKLGSGELFLAGEIGLIAVSADGTSWERLTLPYEGSIFGALPRGEKGAIVFGLRGNVLVTDDVRAGQWTSLQTNTFQSMFGGAMLPSGEALLVGADGETLTVSPTNEVRKGLPSAASSALSTGTLSGIQPWKDKLVVVGEYGVNAVGR